MSRSCSLCILLSWVVLCGCTKYQFFTLKSYDFDPAEPALTTENDTLRITYTVVQPGNGLMVEVFNKSDQPLYIDESRSVVMVSSQAAGSLFSETLYPFAPDGRAPGVAYSDVSPARGGSTRFLPPRALAGSHPMPLPVPTYRPETVQSRFEKVKLTTGAGQPHTVHRMPFTAADSPLRVRSYLTFYAERQPQVPIRVEHSLWVSEAVQTMSPQLLAQTPPRPGQPVDTHPNNKLVTANAADGGGLLGVLGLLGLVLVIAGAAGE